MKHLLSVTAPWIAPPTGDRTPVCARKRALPDRQATKLALALHIVGVLTLVAASVTAIADQSARFIGAQEFIGVHEIPSFISGRVELPPGLTADDIASHVGSSAGGGATPADLSARDGLARRP